MRFIALSDGSKFISVITTCWVAY